MTKYFTQFEESTQTIGTNLAGWTTRGTAAPSSYAPAYGTPAVKKRYANFKCNSSGVPMRNLITWDAIDADANRATVELLGCFSKDATTCSDVTLVARGVGASGAAASEGYLARCEMAGNIYISKRSSVTAIATVATTAFTFSAGKSYFVRFRVNSTSLKLRVWDAALGMAGEPTTWNIDTTDASFSAAGWVGLGGFDAGVGNNVAPWNFLAVATNGDTAVCPRTNTEYTAWLDSQNAIRCVLAEMSATGYDSGGSPYTKTVNVYLSNHGYTSQQQDTPSLRHYDNYIQQIPTFTREMSTALSGQATTGFGDLIISNPASTTVNTGVRDNWLRMRWNRNYLKMYLGDPSWPKHDFRLMIYGRLGMPSAPSVNTIKFPIADLSDIFNAPLTTSRFSTGEYVQQFKPKLFGYAAYIEPPLTDSATLTFTIDDGPLTDISQISAGGFGGIAGMRDNNVSLESSGVISVSAVDTATETITTSAAHGCTADWRVIFYSGTPPAPLALNTEYWVKTAPSTTTLTLAATRGGATINITGSTTGALLQTAGWYCDWAATPSTVRLVNTPAGRVTVVAAQDDVSGTTTEYKLGTLYSAIMFSALGLSLNFKDSTTFDALDTAMTSAKFGIWFDTQKHTGSEALAQMAAGSLSYYGVTPDGLIQVGTLALPTSTAAVSFTESDVVAGSMRLVDVIRAINMTNAQVSYQPWFLTGPPITAGNTPAALQGKTMMNFVSSYYGAAGIPLDDHPDQLDANNNAVFDLLSFDPDVSRVQITELYKQRLGVFEFTTRLSATQLNIGDTISLTHPRYEWKQWTGSDDASPDNTGTIEARYAVVIGIATDVARGTTKIKCFRRIPGYYPTTDLN